MRALKQILGLILMAGVILGEPGAFAADGAGPLVMGVFPRRNPQQTLELFKPLADYLAQQLGREVRLMTAKDFSTFWRGVEKQQYDIVHYSQQHYLTSHREYGYQVILKNEEFGSTTLAGAIAVRADSPIKTLADLKGKKIVFGGDPGAMIGYIVPTYLLRQAGLHAGDYSEDFARNPPNALLAVFYRQADAAGVGDVTLKLDTVTRQIDIRQMTLLAKGGQLAQLPWAVKSDMAPDLRDTLQNLLAGLKDSDSGRTLLNGAKLTALVPAGDEDYLPYQAIIEAVYAQEK